MDQEKNSLTLTDDVNRRKFITQLGTLAGAATLLSTPLASTAGILYQPVTTVTAGQVIDLFMKQVPGAPFPNTVDTIKAGSRDTVVTSIVTTMFSTIAVIEKTIALGANFIIAHEPTFYNHEDEITWLAGDDVYEYKKALLQKHNITIWRNHDTIHSLKPDGVMKGVVKQLNWGAYYNTEDNHQLQLPPTTLKALIAHLKERLAIAQVRYIGNLDQTCQKVLLLPGAAGGKRQIEAIRKTNPDVLVCGEISEWETAEYVRDARAKGDNLSLVLLGHIPSEEAGSEFMLEWLKVNVPAVKAVHIPSNNSLSFA